MNLRRLLIALTTFVLLGAGLALQPPPGQSEFVPVDSVPLSVSSRPRHARHRLRLRLDRGDGLRVDPAVAEQGRGRMRALAQKMPRR
jgi:hypothetical protein